MDGMKKKPGKPPETVRIEQDWEDAVGQAIQKPKPEEGWPKPEPTPQRSPLKDGKNGLMKSKTPD